MPSLEGSRSHVEPPRRPPQGAGDLVTRVGGVQRRCPGLLLELAKVALHLDDRVFNGTTDEGHLLSKRLWAI